MTYDDYTMLQGLIGFVDAPVEETSFPPSKSLVSSVHLPAGALRLSSARTAQAP